MKDLSIFVYPPNGSNSLCQAKFRRQELYSVLVDGRGPSFWTSFQCLVRHLHRDLGQKRNTCHFDKGCVIYCTKMLALKNALFICLFSQNPGDSPMRK